MSSIREDGVTGNDDRHFGISQGTKLSAGTDILGLTASTPVPSGKVE